MTEKTIKDYDIHTLKHDIAYFEEAMSKALLARDEFPDESKEFYDCQREWSVYLRAKYRASQDIDRILNNKKDLIESLDEISPWEMDGETAEQAVRKLRVASIDDIES